MLEQLFGSITRVRLLRLFLTNPETDYFVRELTRRLGLRINSVRQELGNLEKMSIIVPRREQQKKFYRVNRDFVLFEELKALITKSQILLERNLAREIEKLGSVKLMVLSGLFVGLTTRSTDMLIVGKINRRKLKALIARFQTNLEQEINYTVMSPAEYRYRSDLTDRFLFGILEGKKIVLIDHLTKTNKE